MLLRDLEDVKSHFRSVKGSFIGVGMSAYARILPGSFLPSYRIIALRKTRDLPPLREKTPIFCLEETVGNQGIEGMINSEHLLSHPATRDYMKALPDPKYLFLYQSYPGLERLAEKEGWILMANAASLRLRVVGKPFFYEMARDLNLRRIPGGMHPAEEIHRREYDDWAERISPSFVVQFVEINQGGGRGTFFIRSKEEYGRLKDHLAEGIWRGVKIKRISIRALKSGIPASLTLCLTRHGLLCTPLQRQLIDLPYCRQLPENGVFCGHIWGEALGSTALTEDALRQARRIGNHMRSMGYGGILGIDFVLDREQDTAYPIECNPRLTGAFPMQSLLFLKHGRIPMEVFHLLEFLNCPYEANPDVINAAYEKPIEGSHLILFRLPGEVGQNGSGGGHGFRAGLYAFDRESGLIAFRSGATDYSAFRNERQFIVVDGPPERIDPIPGATEDKNRKGSSFQDPLQRLCRILFPVPITDEGGELSPRASQVIDWIYQRLQ
jgi:hypothetical protein